MKTRKRVQELSHYPLIKQNIWSSYSKIVKAINQSLTFPFNLQAGVHGWQKLNKITLVGLSVLNNGVRFVKFKTN